MVGAGRQVWVDTSGAALEASLTCPGVCIKVNGDEIGEAFGLAVKGAASARKALALLGERGVPVRVITLGATGAVLATEEGSWRARAPRVRLVSAVGSGDSFLAGLLSAR